MARRFAPLLAAVALLAVASAPATAKIPKPRQSLKAWAQKWAAAGRDGDCAFLGGVYDFRASDAASCSYYADRFAGVQVDGVQQFGTGGVIRWHSPYYNGAPGESMFFARNRKAPTAWGDTAMVTRTFGYFATQSVPSKPRYVRGFDGVAKRYVDILRRRDCKALLRVEVHPGGSTKGQCKSTLTKGLSDRLERGNWTLYRMGGNSRWSVYGLDLGKSFLTIPLLRDPLAKNRIVVLTWYQSR